MSVSPVDNERGNWVYWRHRMAESFRCDEGRAAGLWALEVLESHLSPDWIGKVIRREGSPPSEVAASSFHTLAASLELGRQIPGMARVRHSIDSDFREESRRHAFVQMELAMLARHSDANAALEASVKDGCPPVDALLSKGPVILPVEVRVILLDDSTRAGRHLADALSVGLMRLNFSGDVTFDGSISDDVTDADVDSILEAAGAATAAAGSENRRVRVEHSLADLEAVPGSLATPGTMLNIPAGTGPGIRRVGWILRSKVEQAAKSGATWLRVDLLDGTWMFTPWAQRNLADKTMVMARLLSETFAGVKELRGVVVSSGRAQAQGTVVSQSFRSGQVFGLSRSLGPHWGRETIVVPLAPGAEAEAMAWVEVYDSEAQWLDSALCEFGWPPLVTLVRAGQST
jgi:hypothetical protein